MDYRDKLQSVIKSDEEYREDVVIAWAALSILSKLEDLNGSLSNIEDRVDRIPDPQQQENPVSDENIFIDVVRIVGVHTQDGVKVEIKVDDRVLELDDSGIAPILHESADMLRSKAYEYGPPEDGDSATMLSLVSKTKSEDDE